MTCKLAKRKYLVASLVLNYLRKRLNKPSISRETKVFTLRIDAPMKGSCHRGISRQINREGCSMRGATPTKFGKAETVGKMIDLFWAAVEKHAG